MVEWHVGLDGRNERTRAAVDTASDLLVGEHREPAFDLVEPRGSGGREVKVEARVASTPPPDGGRLVGRQRARLAVETQMEDDAEWAMPFTVVVSGS